MIKCVKKFDIIPKIIDELCDEVNDKNPSHITIVDSGLKMEFDGDIKIEINNGYLKIINVDGVDVIRYQHLSGWSISNFNNVNDVDGVDVDDIRYKILSTPSTLPLHFLSEVIPHDIKKSAVISFMGEYNGYSNDEMEREINEDDWMRERFDDYMMSETYGELNNTMRDYLAYLWYDDDLIEGRIKEGDDISSMVWINDVIKHHIPSHIIGR